MRKDYPTYAHTLAKHVVRGQKPMAVAVLLSSRWWNLYDHVVKICIKPDDWAFGRYEFRYLQGMHVVAVPGDCPEAQLGELVIDVMYARPSLLWVFDMTGRAIVDGNAPDPRGLARWAGEMAGLALDDFRVSNADAFYSAGIASAAQRELDEMKVIEARSGLGASALWAADRMGWPDRVREQFSQVASEPQAA